MKIMKGEDPNAASDDNTDDDISDDDEEDDFYEGDVEHDEL